MTRRKPPPQRADGRWSDGETLALIDAWGPFYLRRNRGPLLVEEWRLVASTVNAHRAAAGSRFNRTRAQCQRRVHTLKAQYKKELSKPPPSGWRHFPRLHALLASPDGPPLGFPAKVPASVKEEQEVVVVSGSGLVASWNYLDGPDEAKKWARGVLSGGGGDEAGGGVRARGAGEARRREGEDGDREEEHVRSCEDGDGVEI